MERRDGSEEGSVEWRDGSIERSRRYEPDCRRGTCLAVREWAEETVRGVLIREGLLGRGVSYADSYRSLEMAS